MLATDYYIVNSQPIPKSGWEVLNVASVPTGGYPFARVTSFNNGDYIVVYPIVDVAANSTIVAQIYAANGTLIYGEIKVSGSGNYTAPNVIAFSDNT